MRRSGLSGGGCGLQTDSLSWLDGPGPWKCPVSVSSWAVFLGLERGLDPEPGSLLTSGGSPLLPHPRWVPGGHTISGAASLPPGPCPSSVRCPRCPSPSSDLSGGSALCKDAVSVDEIPSGARRGAPRRPGPGVRPRGCLTLSADEGHCQGRARLTENSGLVFTQPEEPASASASNPRDASGDTRFQCLKRRCPPFPPSPRKISPPCSQGTRGRPGCPLPPAWHLHTLLW